MQAVPQTKKTQDLLYRLITVLSKPVSASTDGSENSGGLFSELIACDMAAEACTVAEIVTTLSMLLSDPNKRSLKGVDLVASFEFKRVSFRGPMSLSRSNPEKDNTSSSNGNSGSGSRGWVSIPREVCPSAAVVAIRSAIKLDGYFNGSTSLPNLVGSTVRTPRGFPTGFSTRCALLASTASNVSDTDSKKKSDGEGTILRIVKGISVENGVGKHGEGNDYESFVMPDEDEYNLSCVNVIAQTRDIAVVG